MKRFLISAMVAMFITTAAFSASISAGGGGAAGTGDMLGANNLLDVSNAATSATNIGLGTASNVKFASVSANIFSIANTVSYLITGNTTITVNSGYIAVSSNTSIILTGNITLTSGFRGQALYIHNNGTNNIEFQDNTLFVSSNLHLNGYSGILQAEAVCHFVYNTDHWDLVSMPSDVAVQNSQVLDVRNSSGASIGIGLPVHLDGYSVGQGRPTIVLADADGTNTMPASGVVIATIANNTNGQILINGTLSGIDTSAWAVEDALYVSNTAGVFTNVKPANDKVQSMARVIRSHASAGVIIVQGAGRSNDTPHSAVMNGTLTANEIVATGGITLGGVRNTAWPASGSGTYQYKRTFGVVDSKFPVVDTPVSGSALSVASANNSLDVTLMSATVTQGRMIMVDIPDNMTVVSFNIYGKPLITQAAAVAYYMYARVVSLNAATPTTWIKRHLITSSFGLDSKWTKASTGNIAVGSLGLLPGNLHQVIIARGAGDATDSLTVTQQVSAITLEMQ